MNYGRFKGKGINNWCVSLIASALAAPLLATIGSSVAYAQTVPACSTAIQACGCQIKKRGTYSVVADLDATQGLTPDGDCIELKAPRVTLNLNSHKITGPGGTNSAIGIDIRSGSNYDSINGGSPDASLSGWQTGIEDSGRRDTLSAVDTSSNGLDGIEINQGRYDQVTSWNADNNGAFGAWIKQGSGNSLAQGSANGNGKAGIFIGCSAGGPSGEDCTGESASKGNDLQDDSTDSNGEFGVALDSNSADSTIDTVTGSNNATDDLLDDSCSGDSFSGDSFASSSDGCSTGTDS